MNTLKPFYKILFTMSLCLVVLSLNCQNITGKKVVVIDPGHGGIDSGAVGINGIQEKDIVLSIAKEMVRLNANSKSDFEIYLTRYKDTLISLSDRTRLTRNLKADFFISLHGNQSDNVNARGNEIYVYIETGRYSKKSILLAFDIQKALTKTIGLKNRGIKFANFQVLRETLDYCPTVLVELGFLSQNEEAIYLNKEASQYAIATGILQSINKFSRL